MGLIAIALGACLAFRGKTIHMTALVCVCVLPLMPAV